MSGRKAANPKPHRARGTLAPAGGSRISGPGRRAAGAARELHPTSPAPRTDRAERLLDLVSLFLNATEPVTWAAIRESFPGDYAVGSPDSAARKWERDKAELIELGIPLSWVPDSDDGPGGYVVDRSAYYLPTLSLAPDELALLSVAGAAALAQPSFPFRTDLAHALDKLGFAEGPRRPGGEHARFVMHLPAPGVETRPEILDALGRAVATRKDVSLAYRSFTGEVTRRQVSPFGLAYRRGAWFLVGHCHLRQGLRTFQVARIVELAPNDAKPKTPDFEVPEGFSIQAHVAVEPWQYAVHEAIGADVRLDPEVALLARPKFGESAKVTPTEGGAVRVELRTTNADALVREVLGLAPLAELAGPQALRKRAAAAAARIATAHQGEAGPAPWPEAPAGGDESPPAKGAAGKHRQPKDENELRNRLRRALFLIPYAVAHPGIEVAELAKAARLEVDELVAELDFLRLIGRPPFTPGDYVDILVEDGRVYLALPQGLLRPPTLTPLEAAALDAAASALSAEGGPALSRVREKLRAAVPPPARPEFDAVAGRVVVEAGSVAPETAALVDRAIRERRELELTYFAAGRGTSTRRAVRPLERVLHQGYWYLHAYCCHRRERRLFRLDRAADLVLTDRAFVPRPSDDRARFHAPSLAPAGARQARVRIAPGPWAEPGQLRRLGAIEIEGSVSTGAIALFPVEGDAYLVSLVLSLAGDAEVLEPADLRARVREVASAAVRRHEPE